MRERNEHGVGVRVTALKHIAEYAALRAAAGIANGLPLRAALLLGWVIAWFGFHVLRWRVAEAERRIRQVFGPNLDRREIRRIAWEAMRNFVFAVIEAARAAKLDRRWLDRYVDHDDVEARLRSLLSEEKGAILVIPHMGSWEMAASVACLLGLPMCYLVGTQKNPLVNAYADRLRTLRGAEAIPRDSAALRGVLMALRDGKIVAFAMDLRSRTPGVRVRFLGHEANLAPGMSAFARHTGAPIVPALVTRAGWLHHCFRVCDPVRSDPSLDREADARRMTQEVVNIFDAAVRAQPEQYFWYNKRWVLDPLEEPDA
jgi:KDO2-lipid IV(A) lauroyltransferase